MSIVANDQTLHLDGLTDHEMGQARPDGHGRVVVLGDGTTQGNATKLVHVDEHLVQCITAHVVKVNVNAVGHVLLDALGIGRGLVVERSVEL